MTTEARIQPHGLGWIAIAWISFLILANAWVAYRLGYTIHDLVTHLDPRWRDKLYWALPLLMGLCIFNILSLGLLFARRKVGLYLFLAATAGAAAVNLYIGVPLTTMLLSLIGLSILGFVIYPRWDALR